MALLLNDFRIPGKQLKVAGSMELRSEDIAGETSGTDRAEKGIKPKVLRFSCIIPFTDSSDLRKLIRVAEAKENDEQVIYTITHPTANVVGVRQVAFIESFAWPENETLQCWNVSFALQEHLSNPERLEKRQSSDGTDSSTASKHAEVLQNVETQ